MIRHTLTRSALYVSQGPDLVHYALDLEAATLTRRETLRLPAEIQYAWPHPSGRVLYVASSDRGNGNCHHLTALRIAPDGMLSPHGDPVPLPWRPLHTTVDAEGRYAFATYNKPSAISVHRLREDGRIGEAVPQPHYLAAAIFPHQVRLHPSGKQLLQVAHGNFPKPGQIEEPGSILLYDLNEGVLRLKDVVAPNGGWGFTPRHLDFHPTQPWAYVVLELQNELQMYSVADGRLSQAPLFAKKMLKEPGNLRPRQMAGTPHVHPSGRFVYASNRGDWPVEQNGRSVFGGGENNIAVFAIDPATGEPTLIQHADYPGLHARCFALDPTGQILIAAARHGMDVMEGGTVRHQPKVISVFRIGADGRLTLANQYEVAGEEPQVWMGVVGLAA